MHSATEPQVLECGQIQGMADELSCELVQNYERALEQSSAANLTVAIALVALAALWVARKRAALGNGRSSFPSGIR
jgi:hypothetical protein